MEELKTIIIEAKKMPEFLILQELYKAIANYAITHSEEDKSRFAYWLGISQISIIDPRTSEEILRGFEEYQISMLLNHFKN